MTTIQIIYGFEFLQDSKEFLDFIYNKTDSQERFKKYLDDIQIEKDSNPFHKNSRTISFRDFCQSEHFDPYEELKKIPHISNPTIHELNNVKWYTTFIKRKPDANEDSMMYYIHGVLIDYKIIDIEIDINFGSIQDVLNKIPKSIQDHILEQQISWNWPHPPKIYYKFFNYQ